MCCFKIRGSSCLIFILVFLQFSKSFTAQNTNPEVHIGLTNPLSRRAYYGEFCSSSETSSSSSSRCDAWMNCIHGKCTCLEEFVYDPHVGKCVAKAGGRCRFGVPTNINRGGSMSFTSQVIGCVPNAICSPEDGACICNNKTYNLEGDCVPSHGHLQHCDSIHKCSEYQGLRCQGGVCDCEIAQSIYWTASVLNLHEYDDITTDADADAISLRNRNQSQCVGLAGFPCINSRCTQHAKCTSASENICKCEDGYSPVSVLVSYSDTAKEVGSLCEAKLPILSNCSESHQCGKLSGVQLVCIDGKCNCDPAVSKYGTAQITAKPSSDYNPLEGSIVTQCLGLAGSPCIGGLCTANANCSYSTSIWGAEQNRQNGTCQCLDSYIDSPTTHTCGMGFSNPCTPFSCIDGLVCRNSYCSCPLNTQSYNDSSKSCISPVGGPCGDRSGSGSGFGSGSGSERNKGPLLTKSTNFEFSCQTNAECKVVFKGRKGPSRSIGNSRDRNRGQGQGPGSHCVCRPGFVENESGSCKGSFGTNCTIGEDCDSTVGVLDCTDGTCQCGGFAEFKEHIRKCVGLVGAKCDVTLKQECTDNGHCAPGIRLKIPGTCVCNQGFEESSHYTCEASHPDSEGVLINF